MFSWSRDHYMDQTPKWSQLFCVIGKHYNWAITGVHWNLISFSYVFGVFYFAVWKVTSADWELTAYSTESCSVHKSLSSKLRLIMLHLAQNHLDGDSHRLKCLTAIKRCNILFSYTVMKYEINLNSNVIFKGIVRNACSPELAALEWKQ